MGNGIIIGEIFDYTLLFILALLPLVYKLFFWLYTIQLKEYRWDRFSEFLGTKQGKSALFNIFFVVELILLLCSILIWIIYLSANSYYIVFWGVFYKVFFWYLVILNVFVLGKILRKRFLKPKRTSRLLVLLGLFLIGLTIDVYFFYYLKLFNYTYIYILLLFLLIPLVLFFYNFISLPLVNYKKNKLMKNAMSKSLKVDLPVKIGITGSYGKSSVKEFLSSMLEQSSKTLKTPHNINTELGVSNLIISKLNNTYSYFVAEMGAYKVGEISLLGKIVNHKYGFLTAIGNQHIGIFGNQNNIITGKSEIAESVLKNDGILYVNWDNKNIRKAKLDKKLNIVKYGKTAKSNAKYSIISTTKGKTKFEFEYKEIKTNFTIDFVGEHNVLNITGILAFLYDIGLKTTDIKMYLKNLNLPGNRLGIFKNKTNVLLNDSYNLPIEGLFAGIEVLKNHKGNKILVIDDVLELGKYAEKQHFEIGKKIALSGIVNQIFCCGINNKKELLKGLKKGGFLESNILSNLDNIKNSTILFEGRGARRYFEQLSK